MSSKVISQKEDSPSVAVERALAMLEAVAQEPEGLSNADISRKLQIPKSSASYILRTLQTQGYLNRDPQTRQVPRRPEDPQPQPRRAQRH